MEYLTRYSKSLLYISRGKSLAFLFSLFPFLSSSLFFSFLYLVVCILVPYSPNLLLLFTFYYKYKINITTCLAHSLFSIDSPKLQADNASQ